MSGYVELTMSLIRLNLLGEFCVSSFIPVMKHTSGTRHTPPLVTKRGCSLSAIVLKYLSLR